jgi:hypothetical protein
MININRQIFQRTPRERDQPTVERRDNSIASKRKCSHKKRTSRRSVRYNRGRSSSMKNARIPRKSRTSQRSVKRKRVYSSSAKNIPSNGKSKSKKSGVMIPSPDSSEYF